MNKKKLLALINAKKQEVVDLVNADKVDEAKAAKEALIELQAKFDLIKDIQIDDLEAPKPEPTKDVHPVVDKEKDAIHAFADAARHHFANMSEGTGSEGGYTVPQDIQTRINKYKEANVSLANLVTTENVTTSTGCRTYQKKTQHTGFKLVAEAGKITQANAPEFDVVSYTIKKYAGFLPVTNELLADSDANIANTIIKWLGDEDIATRNALILALLKSKDATALTDLDGIKKAINVTLGQAYAPSSAIVTNDDGLNYLDTLKDNNKQYVLKANQNQSSPFPMVVAVGARFIPVIDIPNATLASTTAETKTNIPFFVGDLKEAVEIFDRQQITITQSDSAAAGSFNAFEQDMTLFRAIDRLDAVLRDADAFVNGTITV